MVRAAAGAVGEAGATRDARRLVAGLREDLLQRLVADAGAVDAAGGTGPAAILAATRLTAAGPALASALSARAQAAAVPAVVLVALAVVDWRSAAIVAGCLPLVPLFMVLIGRYTRDQTLATVRAMDRISTHVTELVRGLPVLVGLGRAGERQDQLRKLGTDNRRQTMAALRTAFLSAAVLELLATLAMALVAVTAGLRLVHGAVPLTTGLAALLLAPEVFTALRSLGAAYHSADDAVEAVTRTRHLLATPQATAFRSSSTVDDGLALAALRVRYAGRPAPAVAGLSARVAFGEIVRLSGASGTGKSTVLDLVAGRLHRGDAVAVDGTVTGGPSQIAHVPQHPRFAADTVAEELRLHGAAAAEVAGLLSDVDLPAAVAGQRCAELSPGQAQLVAFARALARVRHGARLLLLDEPTAHLDAQRARQVVSTVAGLRGRVATLVATHDPALVAVADRNIELR
jgi:ATP-binding cassette subfamily C protein CydCD